MVKPFHPLPIVGAVRIVFIAGIFTLLFSLFIPLYEWLFLLLFIAVWAIALIKIVLTFLRAQYQTILLEENNVTYITGILTRNRIVLPYQRISEASYNQGLVQRIFRVGTLRIDSAGGIPTAIYVADIRFDDLNKILDVINRKIGSGGAR